MKGDAMSIDTACLVAIAIAVWILVIAGANAI
jgi:preprotein translocase subunit Sec61beta